MFFTLSKLVWFVFSPVNFVIRVVGMAALLSFTRFARAARWIGAMAALGLVLMAFSPLPRIVVRPLEDRFPQQDATKGPVAGIIVLGGPIGIAREDVVLLSAGARITKAVELARLHPQAKIVFAGGAANLISPVTYTEADGARLLFTGLGLAPERLVLEDKSRNTLENAVFTRRLVDPKPGERWLLVTSAWHMPRSMATFAKAGWNVTAYPVDFRTGDSSDWLDFSMAGGAVEWQLALHELVGLLAYKLTGRL